MDSKSYALLEDRGLIALAGAEARPFLQGLVSNDVDRVSPERAVYAALLTPQGKYLHDFFIAEFGDRLVLDCEGARRADLEKRLTFYRLRAKVEIIDLGDSHAVVALMGTGAAGAIGLGAGEGKAVAFADGIVFVDPRLRALGARAILPKSAIPQALIGRGFEAADAGAYERLRLAYGIPDGSRDMTIEKAILLEGGFEELHGIDFDKGCYVGQELTARTKHRGLIRKRLMRLDVDGPLPAPGTPILLGDKEAGEVRSGRDGVAIGLVRLERLEEAGAAGQALTAGEARVTPVKPAWARF